MWSNMHNSVYHIAYLHNIPNLTKPFWAQRNSVKFSRGSKYLNSRVLFVPNSALCSLQFLLTHTRFHILHLLPRSSAALLNFLSAHQYQILWETMFATVTKFEAVHSRKQPQRLREVIWMDKGLNKMVSYFLLEIMEMQTDVFSGLTRLDGLAEVDIHGRTCTLTVLCACALCKRSIAIHSTKLKEDWKESGNVFSSLVRVPIHYCED